MYIQLDIAFPDEKLHQMNIMSTEACISPFRTEWRKSFHFCFTSYFIVSVKSITSMEDMCRPWTLVIVHWILEVISGNTHSALVYSHGYFICSVEVLHTLDFKVCFVLWSSREFVFFYESFHGLSGFS